jgi:large subunit ribosomal protein L24
VQTTLLGLAIALILALVSALVAPLVVDWNHYRSAFETEASRLTGLNVQVKGPIDARLLPSPVITLHNVEVGGASGEPPLRADMLKVEVALGPLLRGDVQASEVHLIGPQLNLGLDRAGAIVWPQTSPSFRPGALSISHVSVEDGRVTLSDAASGGRLLLQKVWFNGEIASLAGPFSGRGAVVVGDELYGYRISGRSDGAKGTKGTKGTKVRLTVDPSDHPLTTEFEGALTFVHGAPQFDGTMTLARPVGATLANGRRVVSAPWRAAGTIRATSAGASIQPLVFRYGPEDRALDFSGNAKVTFGAHPHLDAKVSALQLDIDRALAAPDVTDQPPLVVARGFLHAFATTRLPIPADVSAAVDALNLGGTTIESLQAGLRFDAAGWSVSDFKFRAPGMTDVTLSGRLTATAQGFSLIGPATLRSPNVDLLVAWLKGRTGAAPSREVKSVSAQGDVTIASDRMAIEGLVATLDRENIRGRLAYDWPAANRPAHLDAELNAASLDLDALTAFAKAAIGNNDFALPQEGTLALDVGKATLAGVAAQGVKAQIKFDAGKLQIDRLSVGDLGGATLAVSGRIDELSSQPRGQLMLDLDARSLAGLGDIAGTFTPGAAASLRRIMGALAPAKVHAVLTVERAPTAGSSAELHLDGSLAAMHVAIDGNATGEPSHAGDANVQIKSRIDAADGTALVSLLGLNRLLAVDHLPGQLVASANGHLNGDVHVDTRVSVSGFDSSLGGVLRFRGNQMPVGSLQVQAAAGDLRPLRAAMTGQPGEAVPVAVKAALTANGNDLSFTGIAATIGKSTVQGHLTVKVASPVDVEGAIEADQADGATVIAMLLGLPGNPQGSSVAWASGPIGNGAFGAVNGAVTFKFGRADLSPTLVASNLKGALHFRPSQIAVDGIDGTLAGGKLTGALTFRRDPGGISANMRLGLSGAGAATFLGPSMNVAAGTLTANLQCEGAGASPLGLIGSLHGNGTFDLKDARFAGIDAAAFTAAIQAAGSTGAIDLAKVQTAVNAALANGRLSVPQGRASVTITSGAINLTGVTLHAQDGSELSLNGAIDLANAAIDARMTLSQSPPANAMIRARPELSVSLKGPLGSPQRMLDTSPLTNWLTLSAAELQTRRIESIEANRRDEMLAPAVHPAPPDVRIVAPGTVVESAAPPSLLAAPVPGSPVLERLQPQAAPPTVPELPVQPGTGNADHGPATAAAPSPLAAPRDIRPADPRPQPVHRPPAESSWLDKLLGTHD